LLHGGSEALEAFDGDSSEEVGFVVEVAIGGVVGDAGAASHFAEGEGFGTGFGDELEGGVEEGVAEVAVVVGAGVHGEKIGTRVG
jgi:hypothetical protein